MLFQIVLLTIVAIICFAYFYGKNNERYWKKRGVPFYEKNKMFGPFWDFLFSNRAFFEILGDIYKKHPDAPCVGIGSLASPTVLIRDSENIRYITQVDFESFHHKGMEAPAGDPLADSVPLMNGKRWKLMRQNMTPLFSVAKLKSMYGVMDKSAQDFVKYLNDNPDKLKGDAFNTLSTFCSAAIAASVFGITTESIFDSPFLHMAQNAVKPSFWTNLKFSLMVISPQLFTKLKLSLFTEHETFFIGAVKQIISQRKKDGGKNSDFADMCVNLQNKGVLKDGDTGFTLDPTDELMAAQAFFFFVAGVEPSATAMFCTLIELGRNPEILRNVHNEIDKVFAKYDNKLSYESLADMKYLDMVLNEGLRMYPPIGFIGRQCVKDAILPAGNIKLEKGTKIMICPFEVQRDSKLYPEPEKFIPERFERETKLVPDQQYMPFGRGNRICIGERFAKIQMTTGLIYLLRHFSVKAQIQGNEMKYKKEVAQIRPSNVIIEFIPRNIKTN